MRAKNLRIIITVCSVIIVSLIVIQIVWMSKLFTLEERDFNERAVKALSALDREFSAIHSDPAGSISGFIDRPDKNTYLLRVDYFPSEDSLKKAFTNVLDQSQLYIDCRVSAYDRKTKDYLYQFYVKGPASVELKKNLSSVEIFDREYNYIYVNFPNRHRYILERLDQWILFTAILISALTGLLILFTFFLRQRYLLRFQKDFVNNLVHEIKTPLAVMKISAEVLTRPGIEKNPEKLQHYSQIISSQTDQLHKQVEKLLLVEQYGSNEMSFDKSHVAVQEVVQDAIAKLQPLIEQRSADVTVVVPENRFMVFVDKEHLEQAIINVIENALKYSQNPQVRIQIEQKKRLCIISIRDNGIGIEKKYLQKLFVKFYRVPSGDVHNVKGFGLGLNFVKKVIARHRGKIEVHSVPGIGTEFRLIIPSK